MLKIENPVKKIIAEIINFFVAIFFLPLYHKKNQFPQDVRKILVLRVDHIGDVIMSTGIYRHLKKKFPESKVSVLTGIWGKEIIENNPYIDEIIVHNCPWWKRIRGEEAGYLKWLIKELPEVIKKIKKKSFDIGIDLRGDFRHILFFLFLGRVKYKISYNRSGGEYLLERAVDYDISMHEIEKNFKLLEEIGIKNLPFPDKQPEIFLREEEKEKVESFLNKNKISEGTLKVVLHAGAGNKLRMWEEENFVHLIKKISEKYNTVFFLIGGSEEKKMYEEIIRKSSGNVYNLAEKLNIRDTAALIEKSSIFIGNDSSMGHLASCFDTPSIILFGPTNPERCKPYNKNLKVIYHKFPCSPCLQIKCKITKSKINSECMSKIKVEEVMDIFAKMVKDITN